MPTFTLRDLTPADAGLMWQAIGWALAFEADEPDIAQAHEVASMVVEHWGRPGDIGLIAFSGDGEFAGAAWVRQYAVDEVPGAMYEGVPSLAIGMPPPSRGHGLGTRLLRELMTLAKAAGHSQMTLGVVKKNARARAAYEKVGFTPAGDGLYGLLNMVAELCTLQFRQGLPWTDELWPSPMQTAILLLTADGKSEQEIADALLVRQSAIQSQKRRLELAYQIESQSDYVRTAERLDLNEHREEILRWNPGRST